MAEKYDALAKIYKEVGLGDESLALCRRLFNHVQSEGWLGRRILDLGCGVGEAALWFANNGFRVTAVDCSEAMLAQAKQLAQTNGTSVKWVQEDIRQLTNVHDYDLVIALDVFNELRRTRDLEAVLRVVNGALAVGKLFVFDLMTIQSLAQQWDTGEQLLVDTGEVMLIVRSSFNYELSLNTRQYTLFHQSDEQQWLRDDETHTLRGFALQSIGTLVQRTGFKVQSVLTPSLEPFDPVHDRTGRAIFIVAKEHDL